MGNDNSKAESAYSEALKRITVCFKERRSTLDLSGLSLATLPPEIGKLNALAKLDLRNNQLVTLPPVIRQLNALTFLSLEGNQLATLPPEIGKLNVLAKLDLRNNQLVTLPPEIGKLATLTELYLSNNRLMALPPEIGQLTALMELALGRNQLAMLPPEIGKLTSLTSLDLPYNQLAMLPPEIGKLTTLTSLSLYDNQLAMLPPEIGKLTTLISLRLSNNQLVVLPPEIRHLTALTSLSLSNNQLSTLPPVIGRLMRLKLLVLEKNVLQELPESLMTLTNLHELTLHGNDALGLPIEVLGPTWSNSSEQNPPAKPSDILHYYFAQRGGPRHPLNEIKVLVVGESEVGKTSLIRQLRGEGYNPNEDKTHGIERHQVLMPCGRLGEVRLNVWDFGGQDIMHATHQFFLTHRSVYLLVLDSRQNERQSRIDYWLRLIASYGENSPVIVVCNKADQQVMQLNWTALQRDYPQIKAWAKEVCCYHIASTDRRKGLDELRQHIAKAVENHVAEVDKPILASWLNLKDELEKDSRPYLTLGEYHQLACKKGLKNPRDREVLLTLMHQLGSVLHFSEHAIFDRDRKNNATPAHVEELNVLDPGWITRAIYKLLNDAELIRAGGVMDRRSMRRSLSELPRDCYPSTKEDFIISMMRRFEICFAFDGEQDRWLLPDLLHKDEVDTGDWTDSLGFRYQYRVLPSSVIGRLMVRLHGLIARHCLWRTGAKFKKGRYEALVRSEPEEMPPRIDIRIRGKIAWQRREFLAYIRGTLTDIHLSFSDNLGVEELVPVPGHWEEYMDYCTLLLLEEEGTVTHHVKAAGKLVKVKVTDALSGVTDRKFRDKERARLANKEKRANSAKESGTTIHVSGDYIAGGDKTMNNDDHSINIGTAINSQVGQTLTNCTLMVQQQATGEKRTLLDELTNDVKTLLGRLPEDKKSDAPQVAENLEMLVKQATSEKPNRRWYSVSAEGLLEASKWVKDFTGDISGTIKNLGKLIWPDFQLP